MLPDLDEAQAVTAGVVLRGQEIFSQNFRGRKSWSRQVEKVRRKRRYVLEIHSNHQFQKSKICSL